MSNIAELIDEGDLRFAISELNRCIRTAKITIRAPKKKGGENNYVFIDDWPSRLAAIRLLAEYKGGKPVSTIDMRLGLPSGDRVEPPTTEDLIDQLQESGANLREIMDTWLSSARRVVAEEPPREVAPPPVDNPSQTDVVELVLDVPEE